MKTQKIIFIGGGVLLTSIAGYYIVKKRKQARANKTLITETGKSPGSGSGLNPSQAYTSNIISASFPLKKGSKGENVKQLQSYLNAKYNAGLTVDGNFGSKTEAAVKKLTGLSIVTEAMFKQYIGTPLNAGAGASAGSGSTKPSIIKTIVKSNPFVAMANRFFGNEN